MKRFVLVLALVLCMLAVLPAGSALADTDAVVVTPAADGSLHLRAGEGTGYATNGYVQNGEAIKVKSVGSEWSLVQCVRTGKIGYIKNIYISYSTTPPAPSYGYMEMGKNVYVNENGGTLNVRGGAGTSYAIKGYVAHGDSITLLSVGSTWSLIRVNATGVVGYIKNIYIYGYGTTGWGTFVAGLSGGGSSTPSTPSIPAPTGPYEAGVVVTKYARSTVNIRAAASSSSAKVGSVGRGAYLKIYGSEGNWYKVVTKGGVVGYISKNYVSLGAPASTTANLNVRKGAGSGTAKITTLSKGTSVTILTVDGNWCRIRYGKNSYGYVSIRFLRY